MGNEPQASATRRSGVQSTHLSDSTFLVVNELDLIALLIFYLYSPLRTIYHLTVYSTSAAIQYIAAIYACATRPVDERDRKSEPTLTLVAAAPTLQTEPQPLWWNPNHH